ncbi:MAG: ribosome biogenesis GTPase YlqF [Clostridia bacterium]|nr:ribosome biogenesis GTPase YlqF [Clostridia bacterium]
MNIQWFPGHMTKTRKQITEDLKLVDIVYELVDARLPLSSRNPEIDKILNQKPRIVILNKSDLADSKANALWIDYFKSQGIKAVLVSCPKNIGFDVLEKETKLTLNDKLEARKAKGITGGGIKVMIVGIPNVGKSTLINKLSGRASTKTGDRPGVTKSKQWISAQNGFQLLDTPGILWPKFEDENVGLKLAFSGAIRDEIMDVEELAVHLISFLSNKYQSALQDRYGLVDFYKHPYEVLGDLGRKRGCVISGGEVDTVRASNILLDEFRASKLGNITLEFPGEK